MNKDRHQQQQFEIQQELEETEQIIKANVNHRELPSM